jgi:hypothetical protein
VCSAATTRDALLAAAADVNINLAGGTLLAASRSGHLRAWTWWATLSTVGASILVIALAIAIVSMCLRTSQAERLASRVNSMRAACSLSTRAARQLSYPRSTVLPVKGPVDNERDYLGRE